MKPSRKPLKVPVPQSQKNKKRFPWWTLPVIVLCLCLLVAAWVLADEQLVQYDKFNQMRAVASGNVIHGPVYIDDILLTGMTMDEARAAVSAPREAQAQAFEVILTAGESNWRISSNEVPMAWDTESLLEKAYMIGRVGSLEQRYQQITTLTTPVHLYSTFTYDRDVVRMLTETVALNLTVSPVDAAVIAFDVNNRSFAFSDDVAGQTVDADRLYQIVLEKLDNGQYGETIAVEVVSVPPKVTRGQLETNYMRIASYSTNTTSDKNRNNNIKLAAHALNGQMIAPHGEISFNTVTGQRTPEKGYLEAGAIENGRTVQEYGGGVCQVSTTMFNAMVRANCEIVKRKPHTWPSDYVPRGEDAAVDWPSLDLVMRNPTDAPMFITSWYEDQVITVEVYGLALEGGITIELESETTYTKQPTEVVYTYNATLPIGTEQLLRKPRTGYAVQTYKVILKDGVEVSREKFYTSDYRMINEEYEYNDGKPPVQP